jgi:fibronectin type 3 domain-containing protein
LTLEWNANTEPDLAGYKIYGATSSGAYGAAVATVPANATSFVATGLQPGVTYFFVITAFDAAGNESTRSGEVSAVASL